MLVCIYLLTNLLNAERLSYLASRVYKYRRHRRECINLLSEVDESEKATEGKGLDTTKSNW